MNLPTMNLRTMTMMDVPAGMKLSQSAGWNQTAADWDRFLKASPDGCFVAEIDRHVCGTVTTISFENRFAWIGMVLVDSKHRSKGIGTKLLETAIEYLDERKILTIKLDATPQGKPLYAKLGFVSEYEIERWTLTRRSSETSAIPAQDIQNVISSVILESILQLDREVFGADRICLLKSLHSEAPEFTMAVCSGSAVVGYTFGRRGLFADHLGPWMATDDSAGRQLLELFLARSRREIVIVDCLESRHLASLLQSYGFTHSRRLTRMHRGSNLFPGLPNLPCAILGPEFG